MSDSGEETEGEIEQEIHVIHRPKIEWQRTNSCNGKEVRKNFLPEYRNDQRTFGRKCLKCSLIIQASNNGSTNLINHLKSCYLKTSTLSGQSSVKAWFERSCKVAKLVRHFAKLFSLSRISFYTLQRIKQGARQ